MKRIALASLFLTLLAGAASAQIKVSALPSASGATTDDLLLIVDNLSAVSKKITVANFAASLKLSLFAATTSAELAGVISDENGSGKLIFSAGTLNIISGKTLTVSNILTFAGTDSSSVDFGLGGAIAYQGAIIGSGLTQATGKMLGRSTASNGAVEEITVGSGLALSGGTLSASGGAGAALLNATNAFTGSNSFSKDFTLSGTLTPPALAGDVNNYNPTGLSTGFALMIDGDLADRNITGLVGGTDGRIITITNIGATNNLVLKNQSGLSTNVNRFLLSADTTLPMNASLALRYDGVAQRWRPWSRTLSDTGVTIGNYGSASQVATFTVDVQGRLTVAGNTAIAVPESQVTNLTTDLAAKLAAASNLSDLGNAGTARTNLGLGTLATQSGTFSGTHSGASSGTNTGDQDLSALAPKANPTFTGTVTIPAPFTLGAVSVTATGSELNFSAGVTSAIQTQLNGKQASGSYALQSTTVNGHALSSNVMVTPTDLSLAIGTNTQAWDADLDAISAIAGTSGLLKKTAANTWSLDTSAFITASSTDTLTNKTLDTEATGNVVTIPVKVWLPAAGCNNATAGPFWDLPTSAAAAAACVTGTNTQKGVLDFADSGPFSAQNGIYIPADFTGNVDVVIIWTTTATSGNCKWSVATSFTAANASATDDPSFNTASTVTTAAPGSANQVQTSSITSVTITNSGPSKLMHIKISRDGTDGSDTIAATARLIGVEVTLRRAI